MLCDEYKLTAAPGTSKYCSEVACHGRNGTFLASLGALSLLTIASRHHAYRSENLLTLHQAKVVRRETPLASPHGIHARHGTRVIVRNLFGDLPVRVKQRGLAAGQKERDRLWEALKRETTNLMLSWLEPVSVKIRDGDGRASITLSTMASLASETSPRVSALNSMLNVLTQANLICHDAWGSWVPVAASTSTISIKGAISLDPAPTKRVQFLSLGVLPLSADSGHNELFDEINRTFASSSFGTVENDAEADNGDHGQLSRQRDGWPRKDGHSNRQPKARKGVDRYPMFHFRLSLSSGDERHAERAHSLFDQDRANLSSVVETLKALIIEWLDVHNFRSPRSCARQSVSNSHTADTSETYVQSKTSKSTFRQIPDVPVASALSTIKSTDANARKRKMSKASPCGEESNRNPRLVFSDWSRIKSSNPSSRNNVGRKENFHPLTRSVTRTPFIASPVSALQTPLGTKLDVPPVPRDSSGAVVQFDHSIKDDHPAKEDSPDETIRWTDPTTRRTFLLNTRTGCVVPSSLGESNASPSLNNEAKGLRCSQRPAPLSLDTGPHNHNSDTWLNDVLGNWENPVFKPKETSVQQISLHQDQVGHECDRSKYFRTKTKSGTGDSPGSPTFNTSKLSKASLEVAEVIAQVDRKFILVKMRQSSEDPSGPRDMGDILVLIDQHAADERIRVETLLAELCASVSDDTRNYRSKLGHHSSVVFTMLDKPIQFHLSIEEQEQFTTHAAKFAAWGILFDITMPISHLGKPQYILSVATLPPAVSERCKADPQVLITFLRTAVWKYAADPIPNLVLDEIEAGAPIWVRRISNCPEGLIDLLNSRACRSAVMFNDQLNLQDCRSLVHKLRDCVFPFMCAHGRPSMVPLIAVGAVMAQDDASHPGKVFNKDMEIDRGFTSAWKRWRRK